MITITLKVLQIASGDLWAGAEVQLYTLARALQAEAGVDISVILLNHGRLEDECKQCGLDVTVLDETRLNGIQIFRNLLRTIKHIDPDIVHTHRFKENILGSITARLAGVKASIRTVHGAPEHRPPWWKLPKRMLYSLETLCGCYLQDRIVAVSNELADILHLQFRDSHICVIENGIDAGDYCPAHKYLPGQEQHPASYEIGIAGRLVPVKRVDIYIQAAQQFLNKHPNIAARFHIYGDGPLREQLQTFSKSLGVDNIVIFEGHSNSMKNALQQLDVLLMTSDHEGLPMILLEAMAMQVPVIAHATGGIPELLDKGGCGTLVLEQDAAHYARALYELISDHQRRSQIITNASQQINTRYSAHKNATAYSKLYKNVSVKS